MHAVRIGTCGWSYQDWEGVFHPQNGGGRFTRSVDDAAQSNAAGRQCKQKAGPATADPASPKKEVASLLCLA